MKEKKGQGVECKGEHLKIHFSMSQFCIGLTLNPKPFELLEAIKMAGLKGGGDKCFLRTPLILQCLIYPVTVYFLKCLPFLMES